MNLIIALFCTIGIATTNSFPSAECLRLRLETELKLKEDVPETHYNLAHLLEGNFHEFALALTHYKRALELKEDYPEAHHNLADLLRKYHFCDYESPRTHYVRAIELKEDFPEAHHRLADLLTDNHFREFQLARTHYERALALKEETPVAHYNLAVLLDNHFREFQLARTHYERAIELKTDFLEAHVCLTFLLKSRFRDGKSKRKHVLNIGEFERKCAYCRHGFAETVDHVKPRYIGGSDDIFNLVSACRRCNLSKDKKNVWEWYRSQRFYRAESEIKIREWINKQEYLLGITAWIYLQA